MPEKDPAFQQAFLESLKQLIPIMTTLFISVWGGIAAYVQRVKRTSRSFQWKEALFECVISSFAGLITHYLCQWAGIEGPLSVVLVAISAHMGTKALSNLEGFYNRVFGLTPDCSACEPVKKD